MNYKRIVPCIFILHGKAVKWFQDDTVIAEDVIALAKQYNDGGADELLIFDLSNSDVEHDETINLLKKISRAIRIPMTVGGNIARQEDVKKILYAGAKRAMLNLSKPHSIELLEEVANRFGKEKIAVSIQDFDTLFKQQKIIEAFSTEIIFTKCLDLDSVNMITNIPCVIVLDTMDEDQVLQTLENKNVRGVSGAYVSNPTLDIQTYKDTCIKSNVELSLFSSTISFSDFRLNSDGLIPVVVQDYKSNEVLMLAYMNQESFDITLKVGKMCYYSRSRKELWLKGETSGHYQYVKSLVLDCDNDTLLAQVEQIGVACHTGAPNCFFQTIVGEKDGEKNPLQIFESVYETIEKRKMYPKEGSYTNYLFDKGIDKILKKIGEEATELVIAAKNPNPEEIKYELSDFLYHAMVLMVERGVTWEDIMNEMADR